MSLLDLNLATRPFRNNVPIWTGYALAFAALGAITWWNVSGWLTTSRSLSELEDNLSGIEGRMASLDRRWNAANEGIQRFDVRSLGARSEIANGFIERRALSWTSLFNLLEEVQPYEVKMISIRPTMAVFTGTREMNDEDLPDGTLPVAVEGISQGYDAFLEFQRALLVDPHFGRIEPEKSEFVTGGEIQFSVRFLYDPEGRGAWSEEPVKLPHVLPAAAEAEADGESAESESDPARAGDSGGKPPGRKSR